MTATALMNLVEGGGCIGCYACLHVCEKDAIALRMDERGFRTAQIDPSACDGCGKCVQTCPQLTGEADGKPMAACYAVKAEPAVQSRSSSGGAFDLVSRWMLRRGGSVCGVAMAEDLVPTFRIARDEEGLEPMHGSKFAFSDMKGIYDGISKELEDGKEVLFVGLPCQVRAVRNVFHDDRLYTVDLICNGMPSEGVYRRYLEELSQGRKVANLVFRASDVH